MGEKRRNNGGGKGQDRKKKYKVATGIVDPQTSGIYATCNRHHEKQCQKELTMLFEEKYQEFYKDAANVDDEDEEEEEELSIEDSIQKELQDLQKPKTKDTNKKEPFQFIDLGCECVVFIKTRKPVDPVFLVEKICEEAFHSKIKNTRYTQKLTPITWSASASMEELTKLAKSVLAPHFHKEEGQEPLRFAVKVSSRNFNTIEKMDIITKIAECIGRNHGHRVDLKNFDKLILVECFKNNIGMSVVSNYEKYQKFNLQQIFEKQMDNDNDSLSRSRSVTPKIVKKPEEKKDEAKGVVEEKKEESSDKETDTTKDTKEQLKTVTTQV